MNIAAILSIVDLALGIVKGSIGGPAGSVVTDIQALEQIAKHVAEQYQAMAGKPLDLSLLTFEAPID